MSTESLIGVLVLTGLALIGCWRLVKWLCTGKTAPNPWDDATERRIHEPNAVPICTRCLEPYPEEARFCPNCGVPVDPLVPLSPYLYVFAFGDMLRTGTTGRFPVNWITVLGFLLMPPAILLFPFALIYWYFFLRNLKRQGSNSAAPSAESSRPAGGIST